MMRECTNMYVLLRKHFGLAEITYANLLSRDELHVMIALKSDEYSAEHMYYKWDLLCSELIPTLTGGSWKRDKYSKFGLDYYDFILKFPLTSKIYIEGQTT